MSAPPAYSYLQALPVHVFEQICEYLAADSLDKNALPALSLTCRQLSSLTTRVRYRSIRIAFSEEDELVRSLEMLKDALQATGCTGHVRRLSIVERSKPEDLKEAIWPPEEWPLEAWPQDKNYDIFPPLDLEWPVDSGDEFWAPPETTGFDPYLERDKSALREVASSLLTSLVSRMTALKDFTYRCRGQIPACLLSALHKHPVAGGVRLDMHGFCLRSLYRGREERRNIDPDDYELATSPCLTKLHVQMPNYGSHCSGKWCYNEGAVLEMAQGLAPNLKSVSVDWQLMPGDHEDHDMHAPLPPFLGFFPERPQDTAPSHPHSAHPKPKGTLDALTFGSNTPMEWDVIKTWSRYTDFNVLRSLRLRTTTMRQSALWRLADIAEGDGLQSLRDLSLWTRDSRLREGADFQRDMDNSVSRLLVALRPLESLEISGIFGYEAFNSVLDFHGRSLRKLRLIPSRCFWVESGGMSFSRTELEAVVDACPNLTDLEMLIPRMKSNREEAGMYRALSGLRHLDRLSLLLDVSLGQPEIDGVDSWDLPGDPQERDTVDGAINVNMDDKLAGDIFDALCRHRSPRLIRLQPVEVGNLGGEVVAHEYVLAAEFLGRVWVRVRHNRAGSDDGVRVVEVKPRFWETSEENLGYQLENECYLGAVWPDWKNGSRRIPSSRLSKGD